MCGVEWAVNAIKLPCQISQKSKLVIIVVNGIQQKLLDNFIRFS